jgi:hypothetical protein
MHIVLLEGTQNYLQYFHLTDPLLMVLGTSSCIFFYFLFVEAKLIMTNLHHIMCAILYYDTTRYKYYFET